GCTQLKVPLVRLETARATQVVRVLVEGVQALVLQQRCARIDAPLPDRVGSRQHELTVGVSFAGCGALEGSGAKRDIVVVADTASRVVVPLARRARIRE